MKKKTLVGLLSVACLALVFTASPFNAAWAGPIKLKAISFIPVQAMFVRMMGEYVKRVNARGKGEVVIDYLGGPEVIPTPHQAEAVIKGRADMMITAASQVIAVVPQAYSMQLSEHTPMEERKNGTYEFFQKYFNKAGLRYMGRSSSNMSSHFFTNFPVKTSKDLRGHRIGAISFTIQVIKNLGATPVNVPKREWFTSVERNVVDGYTLPAVNVPTYGLHEVTKYMIDHPFQNTTEGLIAMNLDKWNSLPKHVQKLLNDVFIEMEPFVVDFFARQYTKARKTMQAAGMKFVKFPQADAKNFLNTINQTWWKEYEVKAGPAVFSEAKRLIVKK